jgi:hypothetical protein
MPPRRRHTLWQRLRRRLCAGLVLVAYLLTAGGVPLPLLPHKDRSQPFPCMDHACGCRSAEECWRHCCCYTPEEKLAWAHAYGIEPPAYAERPAAERPEPVCRHCAEHEDACCRHRHHGPGRGGWLLGARALECRGISTQWLSTGAVLPPGPGLTWSPWPAPAGSLSYPDHTTLVLSFGPPDPPPRA